MTRDELSKHDGREGRRAYVAVNDKIYDVTDSPHWLGGNHFDQHRAGGDLTEELKAAPHVRAVVERFPVVGSLEETPPEIVPAGSRSLIIGILVALIGFGLLLWLLRS